MMPFPALEADVHAAITGDRAALTRVVSAISPQVRRLALRFFGCPDHADDASQEALTQIVTKLDQFDGQSAFLTWVYRVASNKMLSMKRSPAERASRGFEAFDEELSQAPVVDGDPVQATHDELLAAEVRIGCTLAMLLCLDRPARMTYILGEIVELDQRAAAQILGTSEAAYRKRLERARQTITSLMKRRCGVFDERNACSCQQRIPIAISRGHLRPDNILFATSRQQAAAFPKLLDHIQSVCELRRAAAIYQSHPEPLARSDFAARLNELLDAAWLQG
jgi:RNA polymerase sigma factor (sigma-70 family)